MAAHAAIADDGHMVDQADAAGYWDAAAGRQTAGAGQQTAGAARSDGAGPGSGASESSAHTAGRAGRGHRTSRLESLGIRVSRGPASGGPLRRHVEGRLIGGVAAGIADRTGFDVSLIRAVLVVLALITSGFCAAAYVVAWLLIPAQGADVSIGTRALNDRRGIGLAAALTSALVAVLIIASALGASWVSSLAFPAIVCAAGLVLISRNAPDDEREYLRELADPVARGRAAPRSRRLLRVGVALVLLVLGLVALLSGHQNAAALLRPLAGVLLLIGGIVLAFGPWWLRAARAAVDERQARIRAEERAEMATRVHDSVLQTLALIQRRAGDPQQVTKLARAQERELREWLFDGRAPGSMDGQAATVADGVRLIQQDVEAQHGISVDAVTVGNCNLDEELSALLAAAREATVNAAKWSGAPVVSLFAEVEPESVSLFVRDRGRGFDPDAVPDDRKGLAESVRARVARRGGAVTVRSAPGAGTEVSLVMPRLVADRMPRRP
jgi:signal transduction histidine kinase